MKTVNVKDISDNISNKNKNSFLGKFFKKNVLNKFNQLENGYIKIVDGEDIFEVGNNKNNLKCEINIHNIDFYVFLGSGGLLGATEAYAAGLWSCSDLVVLTQIMIKNLKLIVM